MAILTMFSSSFALVFGKPFVVSLWVYGDGPLSFGLGFLQPNSITIFFSNGLRLTICGISIYSLKSISNPHQFLHHFIKMV